MKNKAIFLDRDGTINEDVGYTYRIEDLKLIPGVIEGLKMLRRVGYKLIIITNQSGIGRGVYAEEDYFDFRNEILKRLNKAKVRISGEYFCPHHPNDECECRKPKTGMLEQAAKDFGLELNKCWMIGDSISDVQTGKNAGCKSILVLTDETKKGYGIFPNPDFMAKNLLEAAEYILQQKVL